MNKNDVFEKLDKLVSIQSVSTDPGRRSEIFKAAEFIKNEMNKIGFEISFYNEKNNPPLIVGKYSPGDNLLKSKKTIGIYAHYDVQPETPVEKWSSPPFRLTRRGDKLFGRGTADDKMHLIQAVSAAKNLISDKNLKNNVVFIFEGEEEVGSEHFENLVKKAKQDLEKVDVFYVLDVGMKAKNIPQIFYALRGIGSYKLTIRIGKTDLHSGIYGNRVSNPAQIAATLFAKIKDESGKITIPGFYENVKKFDKKEIDLLSEYAQDDTIDKKNAGVKEFTGGFLESKIKPGIEINGISSGHTGQGFKTIIPSEAIIKFSVRIVEYQKGEEINKMIKKFIADNLPRQIDWELEDYGVSDPFYTDYDNLYAVKTAKILEEVFNSRCYLNRSGGSIAAAEILQRLFKKPIILTGFTLPDENIHAPDENIDFEMFEKGITAVEKILNL